MAKQKRLLELADDQRCTRYGKKWRCHLPRLPDKSYCYKHYTFNLARWKSNSRIVQTPKPTNAASSREIWAFYNKSNGHPNFYALVDNIQSKKSSVEVTPLTPLNPSDTDVGCGLFRVSDCGVTMEMGQVSHRVWFDMDADDLYKIFPRKGEVWAVDVYDLVEIVSSFDDEEGASGLVLVAEVGQQGFQRKLYDGCEMIRRFRMEEVGMFRYRVSGTNDACTVSNGGAGFSKIPENHHDNESNEVVNCNEFENNGDNDNQNAEVDDGNDNQNDNCKEFDYPDLTSYFTTDKNCIRIEEQKQEIDNNAGEDVNHCSVTSDFEGFAADEIAMGSTNSGGWLC